MHLKKFAFAFALTWAATALADVQPAVQPGGDIPANFQSPMAAVPKGGDIPQRFTPQRGDFQYIRREAMIPMRDGVKLYTILIIPKGGGRFPIMLDRTPYSAEKGTGRS